MIPPTNNWWLRQTEPRLPVKIVIDITTRNSKHKKNPKGRLS